MAVLNKKFLTALRKFRAGKPWAKFRAQVGNIGMIKGLEVTKGRNGWHPHSHDLFFVEKKEGIEKSFKKISERWFTKCLEVGLTPKKREHLLNRGVEIRDNIDTSDYLAKTSVRKWGGDREVQGGRKKTRGLQPFELVKKDTGAFLEYVWAMKSRQQLVWSPGLKKRYGIIEEEIQADGVDILAQVNDEQWQEIVSRKHRAKVLDIAERGGTVALWQYLQDLKTTQYKKYYH